MTNQNTSEKSERPAGSATSVADIDELSRHIVLSVREVAALLGISKDLAYDLIRRDELPSVRLGARIVVPTRGLLQLLEGSDATRT